MLHSSRTILLKNKKNAILRNPMPSDAIPMINFQKQCALETPFLLRSPEECEITEEQLNNPASVSMLSGLRKPQIRF
ncbi:hypothetical protein [Blautia sp. Marseille-P3201T]|uniref:hypothetical protein n=1 Tax=Blautia sp. Marseille-P3201T TaxID=1907659 RepID=UPI0009309A3B|nr:hypothetical protein [Blautia sp. Marseille-P3201T]